jgi:hypothetical protein
MSFDTTPCNYGAVNRLGCHAMEVPRNKWEIQYNNCGEANHHIEPPVSIMQIGGLIRRSNYMNTQDARHSSSALLRHLGQSNVFGPTLRRFLLSLASLSRCWIRAWAGNNGCWRLRNEVRKRGTWLKRYWHKRHHDTTTSGYVRSQRHLHHRSSLGVLFPGFLHKGHNQTSVSYEGG